MPQWLCTKQKWTRVPLSFNTQRKVHDMANVGYIHPQSPASRTLSQCRLSHHAAHGWWLLLPLILHLSRIHQCGRHHFIFEWYDTHWTEFGKLGVLKGQSNSAMISAETMATSTLSNGMCQDGLCLLFHLALGHNNRSIVVWSNSCRVWCTSLSIQARVFR